MHLIKKYGNRRLYDTDTSRYVTLEELTAKIRDGAEVRVVDAKTGEDLTQPTLTQIIFEGRGAQDLLPSPLLHQLVRLQDDALSEFFGRYLQGALELYLTAKRNAQSIMPFNPFLGLGAVAPGFGAWQQPQPQPPAVAPQAPAGPPAASPQDLDALRRELDELKRSLHRRRK